MAKVYTILAKSDGKVDVKIEVRTVSDVEKHSTILKDCGYEVTVSSRERMVGE